MTSVERTSCALCIFQAPVCPNFCPTSSIRQHVIRGTLQVSHQAATMGDALPSDFLCCIFEQLVGNSTTLANASLVSKTWHSLALPYLLQDVDLSHHNQGRKRDFEDDSFFCCVYADFSDRWPPRKGWLPRNLIVRQRAFLRMMTGQPDYAKYTQSFT